MANKKGMNPVEAGMIGAAAGLAVGATAVALSSKENRQKIGKKLNEFEKRGQKVISDLKGKVEELSSAGEEKVKEAGKTLKNKL